jgi:hypothetical protein
MAQIVSLLRHPRLARAVRGNQDWSQQELAEFYRVEAALVQAGMRIESDRGVTDEGDPWFVFCRGEDGETFIHFARIDGEYLIAGPAYEGLAKGWDFPALVRDLISRHPLVQPTTRRPSNLFMHPAALLIAVVGTAFFKTSEAKAMDESDHKGDKRQGGNPLLVTTTAAPAVSVHTVGSSATVVMDANQTLTLIATAMAVQTQRGLYAAPGPASLATLFESLGGAASHEMRTSKPESGAGVPSISDTGLAGAQAPPAHHAVDGSAGELGAWLALTAVLQDLPGAPASLSGDAALSSIVSLLDVVPEPHRLRAALALAEVEANVTADQAPAPPVALTVELAPAALPDVAAVRLVHELDGGSHQVLVQLEKLPDLLAQVIARGGHVDGEVIDALTPPPLHNDHAITMPASGPVDASPDATPAPPTTSEPTAPASHDTSIENAIAYFVAHTPKVEVVSAQNQVVYYDVRVMEHPEAYAHNIDSVTYNFDDGSSLSLVGITQVVHDAQGLH